MQMKWSSGWAIGPHAPKSLRANATSFVPWRYPYLLQSYILPMITQIRPTLHVVQIGAVSCIVALQIPGKYMDQIESHVIPD